MRRRYLAELRKYSIRPLRRLLFQRVLVVQSSEHRFRLDAAIVRNLVALWGRFRKRFKRQWNAWSKTLAWTAVIVMRDHTRRDSNPQLQQEFVGDSDLAPNRIVSGHFANQFSQMGRELGPALRLGLPAPEQAESLCDAIG